MKAAPDTSNNINLKSWFNHAWWALKQAWKTNSTLMAAVIIITFLLSTIPAGMALTMRSFINAVVQVIDGGSTGMGTIWPLLVLLFGITIAQVLIKITRNYLHTRLQDDLNLKIATDILSQASLMPVAFFEDPRKQDFMERVRHNSSKVFSEFIFNTLAVIRNVFQICSLTTILIVIEPLLIVVILPLIIPYYLFQVRLAKTRYQIQHNRATKRRLTKYFVSTMTDYQWVPEIRVLNLAPHLLRKFRTLMTGFRDQDQNLLMRHLRGVSIFSVISTVAFFAVFSRVAFRALTGTLTVGDVAIYGGATSTLRGLIDTTIQLISKILEQTLHVQYLRTFSKTTPEIDSSTGLKHESIRGEIDLQNVSFTYAGSDRPALSNISLHIRAGEIIALVGENAAGKTTLAKLIARLYDPNKGSILLDNIPLEEWSIAHLHQQISFVFQNFARYEASAADNIAYGDWSRLLGDRKEVERVAHLSNAHHIIEALPRGYDTIIGRKFGEETLSDGQWQSIAFARAFAKNAAVLILDEPTSSLDARTEYELFHQFRELSRGRTTIIISHRFSTVSMADRIVFLVEGRIAETGTHQELLSQKGHYASLYNLHRHHLGVSS